MNYPDNIGFDTSDPRSPFYIEPPECDECGEELNICVDYDEDGLYTATYCKNCDD